MNISVRTSFTWIWNDYFDFDMNFDYEFNMNLE